MLKDKLEPSELEKRIVHLENTIMRMLALNEKQHEDYKAEINRQVNNAHGRDNDIADQFARIVNGYNKRLDLVETRMDEFEELLEDE